MIKCLECGKELRHKGALNGHLAFAHGIVTPNQLTLDELRSEVNKLRSEMDYLHRFFKVAPNDKSSEEQTDYLTAYDALNEKGMRLEEMREKSWIGENGSVVITAEVIKE